MKKRRKKCTIHDVAHLAGVSHVTVSRAFSNSSPIAETTRQKILAIARHLGYRPNMLARGLRGGRTNALGIVGSLSGSGVSGLYRSLALAMQQNGYVTHLIDVMGDAQLAKEALATSANRNLDAIVLDLGYSLEIDEEYGPLLDQFIAAVVIVRESQTTAFDQVIHERTQAIREVADYFAKKGRCHPGSIASLTAEKYKVHHYVERLKTYGVELLLKGTIDLAAIRGKSLIDSVPGILNEQFGEGEFPLDSLFCSNDEVAIGAMAWMRTRGIRAPEDVAVVGFNDDETSKYMDPPLASVARHNEKAVEIIEQMLMSRLENPELRPRLESVAMEFIWRASAG